MNSGIYEGLVRHRRFSPSQHQFDYRLFMLLLDLDELPEIDAKFKLLGTTAMHWARFKRSDYLGPENLPLAQAVIEKISSLAEEQLTGKVYLLGQLRFAGIYFSPLNLYFLEQDGDFTHMLAEVSNTPWNQRHYYLVNLANPEPHEKQFHVSPFNPMHQQYRWKIIPPGRKVFVHLESHQRVESHQRIESHQQVEGHQPIKNLQHIESPQTHDDHQKVFDATMMLKRHELNQKQLRRVLLKTPIQTLSIIGSIYWQAVKLFLKGVPLYPHPNKKSMACQKNLSP